MKTLLIEKKTLFITEVLVRGWEICKATFWVAIPFSFILALLSVPHQFVQNTTQPSSVQKGMAFHKRNESASSMATEPTTDLTTGNTSVDVDATANSARDAFQQLSDSASQVSIGTWLFIAAIVLIGVLIGLIIYFGFYAGMVRQMDSMVKGKRLTFIEALFAGFSKSFTLIGVFFVSMIAILLGFLLLVIPGIYIAVALLFAFFLPITENLGVMASLKTSMYLVKNNWWRTLFTILMVAALMILYNLLVGVILGILMYADADTGTQLTAGQGSVKFSAIFIIISVMAQTFILPLMYSFYLSLLYDLRARKEQVPSKK